MQKRKGTKEILSVAGDEAIVGMVVYKEGVFIATNKKIYAYGDRIFLARFKGASEICIEAKEGL